jgi:hypothetical protein
MVVGTRKSNADAHPGRILLDTQHSRRTRKQIDEDDARKKSEMKAAIEDAKTKHHAIVTRIAQLEADEEQREEQIQTNSQRPDRSSNSIGGQKASYRTPTSLSRDQDEDDDNEDMYSPPLSTVLDEYEEELISARLVGSDDDQDDLYLPRTQSVGSDGSDPEDLEKTYKGKKTSTSRRVAERVVRLDSAVEPCTNQYQQKDKRRKGEC